MNTGINSYTRLYLNIKDSLKDQLNEELDRQFKATEIFSKVFDESSWNCALCNTDMTSEYVNDGIKLCHPCYIKLHTPKAGN